jgi:hypothetical protein
MPLLRVHRASFPSTGNLDWMITVTGTYACGNTPQPFDLSSASLTAGRWVILRANAITGWAGATITPPSGLTVYSVALEDVVYSGTTYKCVVVTLV